MKGVGRTADAGIGVLNGVLAGSTGLAGILPTLWCVLRGWPRDEHRAVSQPTAVATFALSLLVFSGLGLVTPETGRLFVIGLPVLIAELCSAGRFTVSWMKTHSEKSCSPSSWFQVWRSSP